MAYEFQITSERSSTNIAPKFEATSRLGTTTMFGTTTMDLKMRWPKIIVAKMATAAAVAKPSARIGLTKAGVTIAVAVTVALGAGTANAGEHTGEPPEIARRAVPAMASPAVATERMSTVVTGVLAAPDEGSAASRELHFQNRLTGNLYTVRTKADGSFSTMLPKGVFDLRGMHGAVIVAGVVVGQGPVDLGQVRSPGPYNLWRLVQWQHISQAIVSSPAPATAYLPNLQAGPQPVAVTPIVSPPVLGAGPNGQPLAPAVVIPAETSEQTQIPAGIDVSPTETPPTEKLAPPRGLGGGY